MSVMDQVEQAINAGNLDHLSMDEFNELLEFQQAQEQIAQVHNLLDSQDGGVVHD